MELFLSQKGSIVRHKNSATEKHAAKVKETTLILATVLLKKDNGEIHGIYNSPQSLGKNR